MESAPEGWFSVENIKELGGGIIIGTIVTLQAVKSGFIVIGDKVKLLVENATLRERNDYLIKELIERTKERDDANALIASLKNSPPKE